MDSSFIKLNNTLTEALSVGDLKNTQISYYLSVQLSPNETYLQITNNADGIVFNGTYSVEVIDSCENVLADVTNNVFIEQFTGSNGITQCAIEYVNLTVDYYGRAVMFRFTNTTNNQKWYTNPLKITNKEIEKTIRFDYKNYEDIQGFSYEVAPYYQAIRLYCEYVKPVDNSEVGEYYQISTQNTISTRLLLKTAHNYSLDYINLQTYYALKVLFAHDEIYIDTQRVTTNPLLKEDERKGRTNLIPCNFTLYKNRDEIFIYSYQIFDGFLLVSTYVEDNAVETTCSVDADLVMTFNVPIGINTGTITIIDTLDSSVDATYTEADMVIVDNTLTILGVFGTGNDISANGSYHINVSSNLIYSLGTLIDYPGISDITTWNFVFSVGMYEGTDYNNDDYLTG